MNDENASSDDRDEQTIRDFLLGRTADADRLPFEKRLLAEPDFGELVSCVEDDLVDDYFYGHLPPTDRDRFERFYLVTKDRWRRVRFSEALARIPRSEVPTVSHPETSSPSRRTSWLSGWRDWALVGAAAAVLLSLGTAVWMSRSLYTTVATLRQAEEEAAALRRDREALLEAHRRELADLDSRAHPASSEPGEPVVVAQLLPGVLRDNGATASPVTLSSSVLLVELRLEVAESAYASYSASILDSSGTEIFRVDDLRSRDLGPRIFVPLQVPSFYLPSGDYTIRLAGPASDTSEELEDYTLHIRTN